MSFSHSTDTQTQKEKQMPITHLIEKVYFTILKRKGYARMLLKLES